MAAKQPKFIILGEPFYTKKALEEEIRRIRDSYADADPLEQEDFEFMKEVFDLQKDPALPDIVSIYVWQDRIYGTTRCFWVVYADGTVSDISYKKCLAPPKSTVANEFKRACREVVRARLDQFMEDNLTDESVCPVLGLPLLRGIARVCHLPPNTFDVIVEGFIQEHGFGVNSLRQDMKDFEEYHAARADLRLVSVQASLLDIARAFGREMK